MNRFIPFRAWTPVGVEDLEPNALDVVRSDQHRSAIAGPGAGKTELLAQRACFLLQTGLCLPPTRILAISFKRDAAANLKDRVSIRLSRDQAGRFDSFTFDAFAKHLVDRFLNALPDLWRPTPDYEIFTPKEAEINTYLGGLQNAPGRVGTVADIMAIPRKTFYQDHVLGFPLPKTGILPQDSARWAAREWWKDCLHAGTTSRVSFPMIERLAELLIRSNPALQKAIQATYVFVFMDEFQDTTGAQYDLVKTAFQTSRSVITAVGDNKQQIMRWAMALQDPFGDFERDFGATRTQLYRNYRSSPELVRVQHRIALTIDPNTEFAASMVSTEVPGEACKIIEVATPEQEAKYIAQLLDSALSKSDFTPRDFAVLVKQRPHDYAPLLEREMQKVQRKARVEADLQDLLSERLVGAIIQTLRLGLRQNGGAYWHNCCRILASLRGQDPANEADGSSIQTELADFHLFLQSQLAQLPNSERDVSGLLSKVVNFFGHDDIRLLYPEYKQGDRLDFLVNDVAKFLWSNRNSCTTWEGMLDNFEGKHAVPIMTIHKSKGLEFHTVIFMGLDDQAWWSFPLQPEESRSAFFVAFSRAKQRVVFTYCAARGSRTKIHSFYQILKAAGVKSDIIE